MFGKIDLTSRRPLPPSLAVTVIVLALIGAFRSKPNRGVVGGHSEHHPNIDPTSSPAPDAATRETGRGREADTPTDIPAKGWLDVAKRVYDELGEDRVLAVAAGVTFYGILAVFPALAALVSLYGLISDPASINENLASLSGFLPSGAMEIVAEQVRTLTSHNDGALGFAFFSGLAISLWSANAGMKAVFDALNVAYGEKEKRNFIWLNLWSLVFTVATVLFLCVALTAVVVTPIILKYVGLGVAGEWLIWAGRWPALLFATMIGLALLYRYGPSRERAEWVWVTPGALFATVAWLGSSMLFSWYVSSFGSYNKTYGSLGAAIGFMTWIWLSATIILMGAELNAETEHQTAKDTTDGPEQPLGARGARMADAIGAAQS